MCVKLGIIGTGSAFRRLHWPVLRRMPDLFRVVALANHNPAKAGQFVQEMDSPRIYSDYRALLENSEVEAVLTAVPIQLNSQVLIDSTLAGKHVLAEKPIAATLAEAREVIRACSASPKVIAIGENFRYREDVVKAQEIISAGEIGEVYCFQIATKFDLMKDFRRPSFAVGTWRHSPHHLGISMLSDCGVHAISALRDILGDVTELYAQMLDTASATEGPDTILAQITMTRGAVGHYLACYSAKLIKESVFDLTALGKDGSLHLTEGEVNWFRATSGQALSFRPEGFDRGYTRQWRNFYRAIRGEEALVSNIHQAYRDLLVVDAALRSATQGQRVRVDYDSL